MAPTLDHRCALDANLAPRVFLTLEVIEPACLNVNRNSDVQDGSCIKHLKSSVRFPGAITKCPTQCPPSIGVEESRKRSVVPITALPGGISVNVAGGGNSSMLPWCLQSQGTG